MLTEDGPMWIIIACLICLGIIFGYSAANTMVRNPAKVCGHLNGTTQELCTPKNKN